MLEIVSFVLGPAQTNAYLVGDTDSGQAVVIDPAWDGEIILTAVQRRKWKVSQIWLTHAHFDHFGGAGALVSGLNPPPSVALHPNDLFLWRIQGGAPLFGFHIDPGPEPSVSLAHEMILKFGSVQFEVRHAPGHTPGHVLFYCSAENILFCGDVIFQSSIGRTDLPGGNYDTLLQSIRSQVLSLPDETRLLSGHGPETNVGVERLTNPFL